MTPPICCMSIEQLNLDLFYVLNVPEHASNFMMHYAMFIAHDLIYLMLVACAAAWLIGDRDTKTSIVKAAIFTAVTLSISEVLSAVLNTPRPFVIDVGHTLIEHAPTGSFPSNHMSIFSGIALSYYFSLKRDLGRILLYVALLVAWSRVYVGVHFPMDMVGAFLIALIINLAGLPLWWKYQNTVMNFVLKIHHVVFRPIIQRQWIR